MVRQDHLMERLMLETGRSRASSHKLTGECLCMGSVCASEVVCCKMAEIKVERAGVRASAIPGFSEIGSEVL